MPTSPDELNARLTDQVASISTYVPQRDSTPGHAKTPGVSVHEIEVAFLHEARDEAREAVETLAKDAGWSVDKDWDEQSWLLSTPATE